MSAFSTISALRRRRPEGLPEGNAAAGGGLQGVACRGWLAGSGSQGGGLAGGALQGAPCWGAPRRGRLAGGASQGALADRHPVRGMFPLLALRSDPLRPAPARPVRPPGDFPASPPLRAPLRFGLLLRRRSVPSLRPACTSEMPRRLRTPATTQPHNPATSQPRNHATTQPRNHAATQPRSLRNPSATQKGPSPRGESPFASGWRRAPIRGTRAGYRLQRPNRRRRPRWDPWRASAGSCSGPPSAPQSARRGQPSEPPKHRPNQSAG